MSDNAAIVPDATPDDLQNPQDYVDISPEKDGALLKKVLKEGTGEAPPSGGEDKIRVKVHYTGWLLDGTKFDSSRDKDKKFAFSLGKSEVIKGWDVGVASMRVGEKSRFRIREDFAYGKSGSPPTIPGGATLVFDVELFSFKKEAKKKWELSKEEKIAGAEKEKLEGNNLFTAGNTEEALKHYKEALDFLSYFYSDDEKKATQTLKVSCSLNAAACCVKDQKWKDAIKYADDVLKIEETNVKALWRKGQALRGKGDTGDAKAVIVQAIRYDAKNKSLRDELELIKKDEARHANEQKQVFGAVFKKSVYTDVPDVKFWTGPLPRVYFDITIDGAAVGRIVFELFMDKTSKTSENFRALCTGEKGKSASGVNLHYKGSIFHRVIKGFMAQGGDIEHKDGMGGESIYGPKFPDENLTRKHDAPYLLSMANSGKNTNGSQFFITFGPAAHLDGKHVVFGRVVEGQNVVKMLEELEVGDKDKPTKEAKIYECGELKGAQ